MKTKFLFLFYLSICSTIVAQDDFPCEIIHTPFSDFEIVNPVFSPDMECVGNILSDTVRIPLWVKGSNQKFEWYSSVIQTTQGEKYRIITIPNVVVLEASNRIICWGSLSNDASISSSPYVFIFDLSGKQINGFKSNIFGTWNACVTRQGEFIISGLVSRKNQGNVRILEKYNLEGDPIWETELPNNLCVGYTTPLKVDKNGYIYLTSSTKFYNCGQTGKSAHSKTLVYDRNGELAQEIDHKSNISHFHPVSSSNGFIISISQQHLFWHQQRREDISHSLITEIGKGFIPTLRYDLEKEILFVQQKGNPIQVFRFKKNGENYDFF